MTFQYRHNDGSEGEGYSPFSAILAALGATATRADDGVLTVTGGGLRGIDVDLRAIGELTPTIAALCALADGESRLRGIGHLRGHETDRLAALATEINRLGGDVVVLDDALQVDTVLLDGTPVA